ncbi:Basement membrane-specific heparan sulfate proteoglycan core protein [Mizuhopecten yessoensis]|uniref:Basement membrane-specific heparan sulfate proteoglycan core protein n=2 Tax=Mizuhopecten yessoensis TaxID=6573 RepID=A0A210Q5W5_MIZYE|nr:Basement membrane-specific heparan sulfate proteoglycan core protein [Mizuhopecten yessoensis]
MHGLCNAQPLDTNGYILCYNCDQMSSPNQCDRITRCPTKQQCYLGQKLNHLSGSRVWESRCGNDAKECKGAIAMVAPVSLIGKRLSPDCGSCCNDANFCNDNCSVSAVIPTTQSTSTSTLTSSTTTSTSSTTTLTSSTSTTTSSTTPPTSPATIFSKPFITDISSSQQVIPGASIYLHCAAGGNPWPSINWGVTHFSGLSRKPNNTYIMDSGRAMYIATFLPENAGLYICMASNAMGSDSRVVSLSVASVPSTQATTTPATTSSPQLSKPVIVYSTNVHHARIGSNVRLLCMASGHPTPTISWTFLTSSNTPDNLSLVGLELHIIGFRKSNYGTYRCIAGNSQGEAYKYFTIAPYA